MTFPNITIEWYNLKIQQPDDNEIVLVYFPEHDYVAPWAVEILKYVKPNYFKRIHDGYGFFPTRNIYWTRLTNLPLPYVSHD